MSILEKVGWRVCDAEAQLSAQRRRDCFAIAVGLPYLLKQKDIGMTDGVGTLPGLQD